MGTTHYTYHRLRKYVEYTETKYDNLMNGMPDSAG